MSAFPLSKLRPQFFKSQAWIWLLSVSIISVQPSWAQDQLSLTPILQPEQVKWTSGPAEINLGSVADIQIPEGYRFTDASGAQKLLKQMNNPVPDNLVGILAPESGQWMAVVGFNPIGFVKGAENEKIDSAAVLKAIQNQNDQQNAKSMAEGIVPVTTIDWQRKPAYDAKSHTLEWAIRAETASGKTVNDAFLLFARRGVLDITTIEPYQGALDLAAFKEILKTVKFKDGQSYADFQKGDKAARVSLAELIVNDESPAGLNAGSGNKIWAYSFLGGAVLMIGGLFLSRKRWMPKRNMLGDISGAVPSPSGNGNGLTANISSKGQNGMRRKKVYDYHKFYADMILELSSPYSAGSGVILRNGNSNGKNRKPASSETPSDQTLIHANTELIASQKNIIEEQKRLMEQQSRLIAERNQLIQEQNELLDRQSEIMENQFSLKL